MPDPTPREAGQSEETPPSRRADLVAGLVCVLVSTLLAVSPHLASLARFGTLEYLGDGDDILYMTISRIAYHGENSLRDPFARPSESSPTLYAWCQFVPLARLTHALGIPAMLTNLAWRGLGGILFGATLYLAFRRLLGAIRHPTAWALGLTLVCLSDPGFNGGKMLVQVPSLLGQMLRGTADSSRPETLGQYRVVTPLLNMPFLLLVVASLSPARRFGKYWVAAGAIGLGLCVQLYFFFWTAAVPALGMVFLVSLWQTFRGPQNRGQAGERAEAIGMVLVIGLLIGAPQVYSNAKAFADPSFKPTLQRLSRGWAVPPGSPARTQYLANASFWGKFALATVAIVAFRLKNLALPWWLALFGFALANSAMVTGLEFENYHWNLVYSPMGAILVLSCVASVLDRYSGNRPHRLIPLATVPLAMVALAVVWRPFEALHAKEAVENSRILSGMADIRPGLAGLTPDRILAGPTEARVALLLGRSGMLFQDPHTSHSTLIPDREVHERHALNAWLQGISAEDYAKTCAIGRFQVGAESLPEWEPDAVAAARLAIFRAIEADNGKALLSRYRPDVLLLPADLPSPPRGGPWSLLLRGKSWSVWKIPDI